MTRMILSSAVLAMAIGAAAVPAGAEGAPTPGALQLAAATTDGATASAPAAIPAEQFATECGACHMAFPPGLLPVRSWAAIMSGLADHFGEDASLDPDATQGIADYLAANAADVGGRSAKVLRGLKASDVVVRVTDTPWWKREHDELSARAYQRAGVTSKSNCVACHGPAAVRGVFEDD